MVIALSVYIMSFAFSSELAPGLASDYKYIFSIGMEDSSQLAAGFFNVPAAKDGFVHAICKAAAMVRFIGKVLLCTHGTAHSRSCDAKEPSLFHCSCQV